MARPFSHPNFGSSARVEWNDREVRLIFEAGTPQQAASLARTLVTQLKAGALNLTLMGKPSSVVES
jgi:hypothetical protein